MAYPQGTRALGERHIFTVKAAATLVVTDIIQTIEATGSNTVDVCATNASVFGFPIQGIASGATGLADRARPGDLFWFKLISGTMDATYVGKYADFTGALGATGLTLTNTNNDVRIFGWDGVTTNYVIGEFTSPESATPTILV